MATYVSEYQQEIKNKVILDIRHNVATKKSGFFMSLPISVENLSEEAQERVQFILDNSNWNRQIKRKLFYNLSYIGKEAILILPGTIPTIIRPIKVQLPVEDMIGNLIKITGILGTKFINDNETGYLYFDITAGKIKSEFGINGWSFDVETNTFAQSDFIWKDVQDLFKTNFLPENNSLAIESVVPAVFFSNPTGEKDGQDDLSYFVDYRLDFLADGRVRQSADLEQNIMLIVEGSLDEQALKIGFNQNTVGTNERKKWYSGWFMKMKNFMDSSGNLMKLNEQYLINRVSNVSAIQFKEYGDALEKEIIKLLGLIPSDNQKDGSSNMMNLETKAMLNADQSPLLTTLIIFENKLTELTNKIIQVDIQSGNNEFYSSEDIENLSKQKIKVLMESAVKEETTEEEIIEPALPEEEIIEPTGDIENGE